MTVLSLGPLCPACAGPLKSCREGNARELFCPKCDWSLISVCLPCVMRDVQTYVVTVTAGNYKNREHLITLAQLVKVSPLQARKLLRERKGVVVCTGPASKVITVRDALRKVGLAFAIEPRFPW